MSHFCNVCERVSPDKNLFCVRFDCPIRAEPIWGAGQLMGDSKIVRLLNITRTAVYYEGKRGDESLILKVSVDNRCHERLKAEARLLAEIARKRDRRMKPSPLARLFKVHHLRHYADPYPGIPVLFPAYQGAKRDEFPFGAAVIEGQDVCFLVLEHMQAASLREYLSKTPQPWFINAVWIIMRLARILHMMHHSFHALHLNLNPESVWIREDTRGNLRPVLMDFGMVLKAGTGIDLQWLYRFTNNAYIPPELIFDENQVDKRTPPSDHIHDLYGLGMLLYEMLAGKPRFTYERLPDQIVRDYVRTNTTNGNIKNLDRKDIIAIERYRPLVGVAQKLIEHDKTRRPNLSAEQIAASLRKITGEIPQEPVPRSLSRVVAWIVLIGLLLMLITLLMAVATSG